MPLLNKVLYFLFLYKDHLVFSGVVILIHQAAGLLLKSSEYFLWLPFCEYDQRSYLRLPFLWYSEAGGFIWAFLFVFFFLVCFLISLEADPNSSENQWRTLMQTLGSGPSGSLTPVITFSELIADFKHFTWNFTFNSKSLCFTVVILSVYGHSCKGSVSLDISNFFFTMGILNHIYLCHDHMLVCYDPAVSSF